MIDFSFFLTISNSCAFPAPIEVNVTAIPEIAYSFLVAILNLSLLSLIAYTVVGSISVTTPT